MSMLLGLTGILLVLVLVAILWSASAYNSLVKARNVIQESRRQIGVELNRRYDLAPNLVGTVRGYASHERDVLGEATSLHQSAMALAAQVQGASNEQRAAVESASTEAVRGLMVSVGSYPNLKSNTNYLELQRELANTEDRITANRRFYNANMCDYNTRIGSVPTNIIARTGKLKYATYFEISDPTVRQVPTVNSRQPPVEIQPR